MARKRHTASTPDALYRQVANRLRCELAAGQYAVGDRFPSQNALARRFETNATTAREALALLEHDGWIRRRFGSGAFVTPRAAERWIGIFTAFDILQPRVSGFHVHVPDALSRHLAQNGCRTEVYIGSPLSHDDDPPAARTRLVCDVEAGRLDGLALVSLPSRWRWKEWVESLSIPAVGPYTPFNINSGYPDLMRQAVQRLHTRGCRRLAMLAWGHDGLRDPFHDALAACGLEYRPEWVRHDLDPKLSGAGWEEFREIWFARRQKPDGILVMDDLLFDEAAIAIRELGIRVPEQLRIVAHANKGAPRHYPFPVIEARMDPERYAVMLGDLLLARLRGEPVADARPTVPFTLIEEDCITVAAVGSTAASGRR